MKSFSLVACVSHDVTCYCCCSVRVRVLSQKSPLLLSILVLCFTQLPARLGWKGGGECWAVPSSCGTCRARPSHEQAALPSLSCRNQCQSPETPPCQVEASEDKFAQCCATGIACQESQRTSPEAGHKPLPSSCRGGVQLRVEEPRSRAVCQLCASCVPGAGRAAACQRPGPNLSLELAAGCATRLAASPCPTPHRPAAEQVFISHLRALMK